MTTRTSLTRYAGGFTLASAFTLALSAMPGCYATATPEPVGYADTTSAPVDIETYPSVIYMGEPVYFYGDHWWHRDGAHWAYYHDEPAELHRQREVVIRAGHARARAHAEPAREEHHEEHR